MRGFVYRPFSAEAAVVNPACELGDTLSVPDGSGGTFLTGLFSSNLVFDSICAASVSAPEDEELDHEYPYIPASERSFHRRIQNVQVELTPPGAADRGQSFPHRRGSVQLRLVLGRGQV